MWMSEQTTIITLYSINCLLSKVTHLRYV
jgi:hypothetical protein